MVHPVSKIGPSADRSRHVPLLATMPTGPKNAPLGYLLYTLNMLTTKNGGENGRKPKQRVDNHDSKDQTVLYDKPAYIFKDLRCLSLCFACS